MSVLIEVERVVLKSLLKEDKYQRNFIWLKREPNTLTPTLKLHHNFNECMSSDGQILISIWKQYILDLRIQKAEHLNYIHINLPFHEYHIL